MNYFSLKLVLLFWFLFIFFSVCSIANFFKSIKREDRRYLDPLPLLWKIFWPLILRIEPIPRKFFSYSAKEYLRFKLVRGGLERLVSSEQFFAIQILLGTASGLISIVFFGDELFSNFNFAFSGALILVTIMFPFLSLKKKN